MSIFLLEYVKPYERFAFSSIEKAKEHFIQTILADYSHTARFQIPDSLYTIIETFEEYVNSCNAAQFNERFSEIATIAVLQLIE